MRYSMMAQRLLQITAFCILSGSALAQGVYVKAGTIGRFDYDTNGKRTRTPESIYTNAMLQLPFSYNDSGGSNQYDTSTSKNDGTSSGNNIPSWTNGWGGAVWFDDIDDRIDITTPIVFADDVGYTAMYWVWFDAFDRFNAFLGSDNGASDFSRILADDVGGYYRFYNRNNVQVNCAPPPGNGAWHHVAFVATGANVSNILYYIDGVLNDTDTLADSSQQWKYIGNVGDNTGAHDGGMDDVRIYSRALSTNEIFTIHADTTGDH